MTPSRRKGDNTYKPESSPEQQTKNGKEEKKGKSRYVPHHDNMIVNSETRDVNTKPAGWEDCLQAARWIPRAYDMYCNLEEVVRVGLIIEDAEAMNSNNEDEDGAAKVKATYDKVFSTIGKSTVDRYQRIYKYLEENAPYLFELIHRDERSERTNLIRKMQSLIYRTRSDDANHFRRMIGSYAAPDPDKKVLDPPVPPQGPRDRLGFDHPELARLICPVRHLQEMLNDPVVTKKKIETGAIKVTALQHPAFLYEGDIPGADFDPEDAGKGFLRGYFLERTMKHIFTSPSSALSTIKSPSARSSNAKIHKMRGVDAYHIAYAAAQARMAICAHKIVDVDGHFKFHDFYYRMVDFLVNDADLTWVEELYAHYNKLLFGNGHGVGHDTRKVANEDPEDDNAIMKKQMAERAAKAGAAPELAPATMTSSNASVKSSSTVVKKEEYSTSTPEVSRLTSFGSANASGRGTSPRQPGPSTPSTVAKGKRKRDAVPLDPDSPLADVAEAISANANKRCKKVNHSAGNQSTGITGRKSRSRKWYSLRKRLSKRISES